MSCPPEDHLHFEFSSFPQFLQEEIMIIRAAVSISFWTRLSAIMVWWSKAFNLIITSGAIPLHANILVILTSIMEFHNSPAKFSFQNQVTVQSDTEFLNCSETKSFDTELVILEADIKNPYRILQILDKIEWRHSKFCDAYSVIVLWPNPLGQLVETVQNWPGIKNFGARSNLYFALGIDDGDEDETDVVEIYSVLDMNFISRVNFPNGIASKMIPATRRRRNFNRARLTVGHGKSWNFNSSSGLDTVMNNPQTITITYQNLAFLQDFSNFRIQTVSLGWFKQDADGQWSGAAKQTHDFVISATQMTSRLASEIRYLSIPSFDELTYANYADRDSSRAYIRNVYAQTFRQEVWFLMLITIIVLLVSRIIFTRDLENSVWLVISRITLKEWGRSDDSLPNSTRGLMWTTSCFCFILYVSFSSHLISWLSVPQQIVDTIETLIDKGYSFGIRNDSYLINFRKVETIAGQTQSSSSSHPVGKSMFSYLHPTLGYIPTENGTMEALRTPKFAYLSEANTYPLVMARWDLNKICEEFKSIPVPKYRAKLASYVAKRSQFVEQFNYGLITMKQGGVTHLHLQKLKSYRDEKIPECPKNEKIAFELKDVWLPFLFIISGIVTSTAILFGERCLFKSKI